MSPTTEIEVVQPTGIIARPRRITPHRLDRAAKELNLISVNAKGLRGIGAIGRFLDQIGILDYGNGRLIATAEAIALGIRRCSELANGDGVDEDARARFLELQLRFCQALDHNVALMVELNQQEKAQTAAAAQPAHKPFLPGAQVPSISLQVNNLQTPQERPANDL